MTQEAVAPSRHDWKIVDWDVKPQHKQIKYAEGIANSVDSDQIAPLGAVWSGSALFAQTCLSENLGKLR